MTTTKYSVEALSEQQDLTDWNRIDAMTDEDIVKAVAGDPDSRLLDENDFKKMRRRGAQKAPKKQSTTIRLDSEIIDFFKSKGKGWQTEINDVLQRYVNAHQVV